MTALTRAKPDVDANVETILVPPATVVKSGAVVYQGSTLAVDPSDSSLGKVAAAAKPFYRVVGVAAATLTGDGVAAAYSDAGLFERENSAGGDEVLATLPIGWPLYAVDDQTVSLTDGGGTRAFCGVFGGMSAANKPLVWIGCDPIGLAGRGIRWPIKIGEADLTAAAGTQTLSIGPTLPGPCRVLGYSVDSLTVFTGGGASAVTLAIGVGADVDAVMAATSIFTGAAAPFAGTAGVLGYRCAPLAAGDQINATVAADVNVADLTAGAVVGHVLLLPGS